MSQQATRKTIVFAAAAALALAGCTSDPEPDPDPTTTPAQPQAIATVQESIDTPALVASEDPVELALAASELYFSAARVVVLVPAGDDAGIARASSIAAAAGVPVLLTNETDAGAGADLEAELIRLGARSVVTVGAVDIDGFDATGLDVVPDPQDVDELAGLLEVDLSELDPGSDPGGETSDDGQDDGESDPEQEGPDSDGDSGSGSNGDDAESDEEAADGENASGSAPAQTEDAGEDGDATPEDDQDAGDDTPPDSDDQSAESDAAHYLHLLATLEPGEILAVEPAEGPAPTGTGELIETVPTERLEDQTVISDGDPAQLAAAGSARAAGAEVIIGTELAESPELIGALDGAENIVGFGVDHGDEETFVWRALTAASGVELPGGGQQVFGDRRYIALYGHPETTAMGVLGEQDTEETIERAAEFADPYRELTDDEVIPALEIIVSVASTSAGDDGNYSRAWDSETFIPLIEAAADAGQYVVLDFQPGRNSFLDQIKQYEDLLSYPHVGVALDPEWRLESDQRHLEQIGQVGIEEVNDVVHYLADFVAENRLPQKMLILHQFQLRMIVDREDLDTSRPEVGLLIHADGQGAQSAKQDTWDTLHQDAPDSVAWGWKNFIDEDDPMLTPEETYEVEPLPEFVSYQ